MAFNETNKPPTLRRNQQPRAGDYQPLKNGGESSSSLLRFYPRCPWRTFPEQLQDTKSLHSQKKNQMGNQPFSTSCGGRTEEKLFQCPKLKDALRPGGKMDIPTTALYPKPQLSWQKTGDRNAQWGHQHQLIGKMRAHFLWKAPLLRTHSPQETRALLQRRFPYAFSLQKHTYYFFLYLTEREKIICTFRETLENGQMPQECQVLYFNSSLKYLSSPERLFSVFN